MKASKIITLFFAMSVLSCQQPTDRGSDEEIGSAKYNIAIYRNGPLGEEVYSQSQLFSGVNAKWNPTVLVIDLGPEDQHLGPNDPGGPQAHLTITIQGEFIGTSTTPEDLQDVFVDSAILVTSDVVVGTADELNGKTYTLTNHPKLNVVALSKEYIKVESTTSAAFEMTRVILNQNDVPEDIKVDFDFTALDKLN